MSRDLQSQLLAAPVPTKVTGLHLLSEASYYPSPSDWRDQVLYFLLPDRFSDGQEANRPLVDPARPKRPRGFSLDKWAESGAARFQGGTIKGIASKLDYLEELGVTCLWIAPIFKQRAHENTYHGYAIQNFLDVDPRFGTREDLVNLVKQAHAKNIRVILDIIFNHTGNNWAYNDSDDDPPYKSWPGFYEKGPWRNQKGDLQKTIKGPEDGVWPIEFQSDDFYTRAGHGSLGEGSIDDQHAEFRRSDFDGGLRDLNYDGSKVLNAVLQCYRYWIALTDCDGFRIDTLKHVDEETGRRFCAAIHEFATTLGKNRFFLVGEVAGGDNYAERYLEILGNDLDATLDIGLSRMTLAAVSKGSVPPSDYFNLVGSWPENLGNPRELGRRHVAILDDHDHVAGAKLRVSAGADSDYQVVVGVAIQLFTLCVPCIYYGTEQAFSGPEESTDLPDFGGSDRYLREAMFGPEHPLANGLAGYRGELDALPGFGPWGSSGAHAFNPKSNAFVRIRALLEVRRHYPVLRQGRQFLRQIANFGQSFALPNAGEIIAWSRILSDQEAVVVINGNGQDARGGEVLVDFNLHGLGPMTVLANTAEAANPESYSGPHRVGSRLEVQERDGALFVSIDPLGPSEVLVLLNSEG